MCSFLMKFIVTWIGGKIHEKRPLCQNKRMNEYDGILATKIVQIYKHTFFKILLTG